MRLLKKRQPLLWPLKPQSQRYTQARSTIRIQTVRSRPTWPISMPRRFKTAKVVGGRKALMEQSIASKEVTAEYIGMDRVEQRVTVHDFE